MAEMPVFLNIRIRVCLRLEARSEGGENELGYSLNRIQYVIMNIMLKHKAIDYMHSMSCYEIKDIEDRWAVETIYKHIRILESYGLVEHGAKAERANGYILTRKAIDLLPKNE